MSKQVNDKTSNFRLVLGDIVNVDIEKDKYLDLLNENVDIKAALNLNRVAQEAVDFLKQKSPCKTLDKFCHAKYIYILLMMNDLTTLFPAVQI